MLNGSTIVPDGVVLSSRSGEAELGMLVSGGAVVMMVSGGAVVMMVSGGQVEALLAA